MSSKGLVLAPRLRRALLVSVLSAVLSAGAGAGPALAVEDFPPNARNDSSTATTGEAKTIDVMANDENPDEDGLTIIGVGLASNGLVATDGQVVTYTSNPGYVGPDSFTYTVEDGGLATDTATVSVDVQACDPLAETIDVGGIVTGEEWIHCSSFDAVGAVGDMTPVMNMTGTSQALMTTGSIEGANPPNTLPDSGVIHNTEHRGAYDVSILELDLNVPTGVNCLGLELAFQSEEYPENVDSAFNDGFLAELDQSNWEVSGASILAPNNFAFDGAGNIVSVNSSFFDDERVVTGDTDVGTEYDGSTPLLEARTPIEPGPHTLYLSIFDATDHEYDSAVFMDRLRTFTAAEGTCVRGAKQAPNALNDSLTTPEDSPNDVNVLANDSDPDGDPITIIEETDGTHGTVTCATTTCTYTPEADYHGTDSFTYRITDGFASDRATVQVNVTSVPDPPQATDDSLTTDEDDPATVDVLSNDDDVDGDALSVTDKTNGTHGTVTCSGSSCTYTPELDYSGPDSFTYTVSDGALTDTATVSVQVVAINDPPDAVNDSVTTGEDQPATLSVLDNDDDADGDTLTITASSQPANGSVDCTASSCEYTPDPNYNGPDSFTYTVSDGKTGTDSATVAITVSPVPDPPVAANDSATTQEDLEKSINVLANDADPDNDSLSVTSKTSGTHGTVNCSASACTYTPDANWSGTDSFTYTISDGNGGTDTATVDMTVTAVNDPPVAQDDSLTIDEDTAGQVSVLTNDNDDADGDTLTISDVTQPAVGSVQCTASSCEYVPDPNESGSDSFAYTVSDGNGGTDSATVSITVSPVPDPPVAVNDSATTDEDQAKVVSVLENDSDADGDTLGVSAETNGTHGTVNCSASACTYTPDANWSGTDSFTYSISDGNGGTDTATVNMTVTAVNDPPVAQDDSLTTDEDTAGDVSVLTNDADGAEGDPLTVTNKTNGTNGSVSCTTSVCTYTPNSNFKGTDGFTYTVSDGNGGTDTASVSVTVDSVNDQPVASNDTLQTRMNRSKSVTVLTNDSDVDGDTLTISSKTNGTHGTVDCSGASCTYTPDTDWTGSDSFTYTVSDGNGGSAVASVSVTVAANQPPNASVAPGPTTSVDEGDSVDFNATGSSDDDGEISSYSWSVSDGRTMTGTSPSIGFADNGSFDVTLEVCDDDNACDTATTTVTVDNVAPTASFTSQPTTPLRINTNTSSTTQPGAPALFTAGATDPGGMQDELTYEWDFGDGTSQPASSSPDANHAYKKLGRFTATVTVRDGDGGVVSATSQPLNVLPTGTCGKLKNAYWGKPGVKATVVARTQFWYVKGKEKRKIRNAFVNPGQVVKLQAKPGSRSKFQQVCIKNKRYFRVEKVTRSLPKLNNEYLPESALLRLS